MSRQPFWEDADFACLKRAVARSEDQSVMAARMRVVHKLWALHTESLGGFMRKHGLYPHWQKKHWTNVPWPEPVANGGWVTYLRLGYGKNAEMVRLLAKRSGVFEELTRDGRYDKMAFHLVSMLQVGIDGGGWWVNFYMDDMAWLEQFNLLEKVRHPEHRDELIRLLDDLQVAGYELVLYREIGEDKKLVFAYPDEFLEAWQTHREQEKPVLVSVELPVRPDAPEDDTRQLPSFVLAEFERLLPLYRFCSWDPEKNSFLQRL